MKRFPKDFMFQLTKEEFEELRFQIEILEKTDKPLSTQIATSNRGGTRYLPYVFTEQGVAMLSGILNSDQAIRMPARMNPFGREYCYYASFCRDKKSIIEGE